MKRFVPLLFCFILSGPSFAGIPQETHTEAAVIAADDAWMDAEIRGDAEFLNKLLLDNYVSVGTSGKVSTKSKIVDGARKRGQSDDFAKEVAAWKAHHPSQAKVQIFGDTAVLTWVLTNPALAGPVSSSDIFVYRSGHWRAIYSQHSTAAQ